MTNTLLSELNIVDSIYFLYLEIRIRVSMMLYDMILCHISVTCHGHSYTEGYERFWNNNVI